MAEYAASPNGFNNDRIFADKPVRVKGQSLPKCRLCDRKTGLVVCPKCRDTNPELRNMPLEKDTFDRKLASMTSLKGQSNRDPQQTN